MADIELEDGSIQVINLPMPQFEIVAPPESQDQIVVPVVGPAGPRGPAGDWTSEGGTPFTTNVEPLEAPDGVRLEFSIPQTYLPGSLAVYLNGLREIFIVPESDNSFRFTEAPQVDDIIRVDFTPN